MKESTLMGFGIAGIILLFVAAMCFPLLTIWAINTLLFPIFSIPYSWSTYFAMIIVQWIVSGGIVYQLGKIKEKL